MPAATGLQLSISCAALGLLLLMTLTDLSLTSVDTCPPPLPDDPASADDQLDSLSSTSTAEPLDEQMLFSERIYNRPNSTLLFQRLLARNNLSHLLGWEFADVKPPQLLDVARTGNQTCALFKVAITANSTELPQFQKAFWRPAATLGPSGTAMQPVSHRAQRVLRQKCFADRLTETAERRKAVVDLYDAVSSAARTPVILDAGSLIGAARFMSFVPYDYDVDFRIDWADRERVRRKLTQLAHATTTNASNSHRHIRFFDTEPAIQHWKVGLLCDRTAPGNRLVAGRAVTDVEEASRVLDGCGLHVDFFFNRARPARRRVELAEPPFRYAWADYHPLQRRPFLDRLMASPRSYEAYFRDTYQSPARLCRGNLHSQGRVNPPDPALEEDDFIRWLRQANCDRIQVPCSLVSDTFLMQLEMQRPASRHLHIQARTTQRPEDRSFFIDRLFVTVTPL